MMSRRAFSGLVLGGVVLAVGACGEVLPEKYRFRLTVEVSTPQGVRQGSSVYEIWANPSLPGSKRRFWGESGEAVVVDLPNGKTLFALLKTSAMHGDMTSLSMATLDPALNNDIVESAIRIVRRQGISSPSDVKPENYPEFATFGDIDDPKSVMSVNPANLATIFGNGYAIKAVTAELTDAPVVFDINRRFKWWDKYRNVYFDGSSTTAADMTNQSIAAHMSSGSFTTEFNR